MSSPADARTSVTKNGLPPVVPWRPSAGRPARRASSATDSAPERRQVDPAHDRRGQLAERRPQPVPGLVGPQGHHERAGASSRRAGRAAPAGRACPRRPSATSSITSTRGGRGGELVEQRGHQVLPARRRRGSPPASGPPAWRAMSWNGPSARGRQQRIAGPDEEPVRARRARGGSAREERRLADAGLPGHEHDAARGPRRRRRGPPPRPRAHRRVREGPSGDRRSGATGGNRPGRRPLVA